MSDPTVIGAYVTGIVAIIGAVGAVIAQVQHARDPGAHAGSQPAGTGAGTAVGDKPPQ